DYSHNLPGFTRHPHMRWHPDPGPHTERRRPVGGAVSICSLPEGEKRSLKADLEFHTERAGIPHEVAAFHHIGRVHHYRPRCVIIPFYIEKILDGANKAVGALRAGPDCSQINR